MNPGITHSAETGLDANGPRAGERPIPPPAGVGWLPARRLEAGHAPVQVQEWVADEVPVALVFNGISHAVMLASPAELQDFALGFAFTEGLIHDPADVLGMDIEEGGALGTVVHLQVTARVEVALKLRRRSLAGRTGCGLCGVDSLAQVLRAPPAQRPAPRQLRLVALQRAQQAVAQAQVLQALAGGLHAAAWCRADGSLGLLREDVGRHNALDKLVGALLRQRLPRHEGFVLVTSRASVEMVQKAAHAGVGLLAAVSAPTRLAVEQAVCSGLSLVGFVRGRRATVYADAGWCLVD